MALKKYIDQNGNLLYCNPIDNTDDNIKCFDKENDPEIACNGRVSFPEGCGYPLGYNTRYSYVRFFKIEYDVPEEITCAFPRLIGSFFDYYYTENGNFWENNWWWGWYDQGRRSCSQISNRPYNWGARTPSSQNYVSIDLQSTYPSDLGRCSERPENTNVFSRLASCKTLRCVPLNLNNMSHKCEAINQERELNRCCVGASDCGPNNNCKAEASRIEKTYTVSYEIVRSGFYCLEELPEAPEEPTCLDPYFAASQAFLERGSCEYSGGDDCNAQGDVNYSCVNREDLCSDGGSGSFFSLSSKEACSISYRYKKKDCDCQCSSCANCSSFENDSCMYGLGDGYGYYYNYNFSYVYLIGSDCCSAFGNYGNWYWWWGIYSICPSSDDPPNSKFVFDASSTSCVRQDGDSVVEPPDIDYGINKTGCFLREDPFDRKCIPPYPNWVLFNACDTEAIDDYSNSECWERGPAVTKTISYANKIITNRNTDKCLPDDTSNPGEPPKTVEYASFKPKYCEQEIIQITNYNLVYTGNMPTNLRDWIACNSRISSSSPCFDCVPAEEICYEDKRSLVLYSLVYTPEEVLETVDANVTITYCQMSITKC